MPGELAMIISVQAAKREILSARPEAPVLPYREQSPRGTTSRQARTALADLLHRAARAVEPAECTLAR
ncbi:hypothetical protein ACFFWC_15485 [Plantactinospora siamensis]|uniref:Uncharacterized protein n=1 Tax=Plantactinospora siamensis TaxID=555372 RepID=A0ABV6P0I0_9ACTN